MALEIIEGAEAAAYVADTLNISFALPYRAMGLKRDRRVVAGVVFNGYTTHDVEITVAATELPRRFLQRVARYVVVELGCIRATITTEQERVVKSALRLGAQIEGRKRNHFGAGRDATMLGILREDWKFR